MRNPDVLIVGAGPTGMMLALELALQEITFRIVDSATVRSDKSRALVVHPRSLELLSRHSVAEKLLERGTPAQGVMMYSNKQKFFEIRFNEIPPTDTAFPLPQFISQAATEQAMDEALLEKYGKTAERGVAMDRLAQDDEGVTVWLKRDGGIEEELRCKYVVGCDGSHSVVRKFANLKFEGSTYPQEYIMADVHVKWENENVISVFMGAGLCLFFPLGQPDLYRIFCPVEDAGSNTEPALVEFEDIIAELVPGKTELFDPVWATHVRLHHRIAESYRRDRVFVAGDAAHIHSPVGGQGMNTGMQDAANLGWKLAHVLRGQRQDSFLDTYNMERRKVGQALLSGTDRVWELLTTTNALYRSLRNILLPRIIPWVLRDENKRAQRFRFISQLAIRYRESPIVGTASAWLGSIRGGDRAPDGWLTVMVPNVQIAQRVTLLRLCENAGYHLILFSGNTDASFLDEVEAEFSKKLSVLKIVSKECMNDVRLASRSRSARGTEYLDAEGKVHASYQFMEPGYVLVRPDGYISFIGRLDSLAELRAWMDT